MLIGVVIFLIESHIVVFSFFVGSFLVSWESRKQHSVALSSTEAEYMAASEAAKEAVYQRRLLMELDRSNGEPMTSY